MRASREQLQKRRAESGDEGGFTLIELLIVVVILGVLAAIVVFAVQSLTSSSSKASCGSDYKTVETAVESYKAQMGGYPNNTATTADPVVTNNDPGTNAAAAGGPLLTGSNFNGTGKDSDNIPTTNVASPSNAPVGPWLKDVPSNPIRYTILVANDGSGAITVNPAGTTANPCANAK